jgi:DNA-binding LytR/AlgR family response regulator
MRINCLIIEDEPLAASILEAFIAHFDNLNLINTYSNAIDALPDIKSGQIDLIFLDLNMSKINGLDFLRSLKTYPLIVITTAYREYALESYELEVVDYLVKPIPMERFLKAVDKVTARLEATRGKQVSIGYQDVPHVFLKIDKRITKFVLKDIIYIESLKDYIKLCTVAGNFIAYKSLTSIIEELPSDNFIRVHKSYAIAIDKVKAIEGNILDLGIEQIPMGRNYIAEVKNRILGNKGLKIKRN